MKSYKIGEVARRTGLSIRTLRYYDEIGLLTPTADSQTRHRQYSEPDIARLQQIISLRQVGCSLDEIKALLDDPNQSAYSIIETQIEKLNEELQLRQSVLSRLQSVAFALKERKQVAVDEIIELIRGTIMIEKYYTKDQLDYLKTRADQMGEDGLRAAERQWATLIDNVRTEMKRGSSPDCETVKRLAIEWRDLIAQFTGGNPEVHQSLKNMYEQEGPEQASRGAVDMEVCNYIYQAIALLD